MPLNPKASFIADPARATQLFPAKPCRQCNGSGKVQRYKVLDCEACGGTGKVGPGDLADLGLTSANCQQCWNDNLRQSTGKRQVPENIPCPACQGKANVSRVRESRPTTLNAAKPADWVVIGVEFPAMPIEDAGEGVMGASAELVSCMIVRRDPTATRIIARVLQSPEYADLHGLRYGDLLELGPNHILVHTQCTPEEFEKARDGGLFNFAPVMPIPPQPGRAFITRGGTKATIWTTRTDPAGQFAIGAAGGRDFEWNMDGSERSGRREYDLVQFTEVVNA